MAVKSDAMKDRFLGAFREGDEGKINKKLAGVQTAEELQAILSRVEAWKISNTLQGQVDVVLKCMKTRGAALGVLDKLNFGAFEPKKSDSAVKAPTPKVEPVAPPKHHEEGRPQNKQEGLFGRARDAARDFTNRGRQAFGGGSQRPASDRNSPAAPQMSARDAQRAGAEAAAKAANTRVEVSAAAKPRVQANTSRISSGKPREPF